MVRHQFVEGNELGVCAQCGEYIADPIHVPEFTAWQPYTRDAIEKLGKGFFIIRPVGLRDNGKPYTPSIVRRQPSGVLVDAGNNLVRLNYQHLEYIEIPA